MVSYRKQDKELLSKYILNSIMSLPDLDRNIFILKHYRGMSESEIGRIVKLPLSRVANSLRNSTRLLLSHLHPIKNRLA